MMDKIKVCYHYNAGVSVEFDDTLLIFNYWSGGNNTIPQEAQITPDTLKPYQNVYVFICNGREDIYDPIVYKWHKHKNIQYIVSTDVELQPNTQAMKAGQTLALGERIVVSAYPSTDKGIAFLLCIDDETRIFNAGTLNLWHWMESSTTDEIHNAQEEYESILADLPKENILLAFYPLDARQGLHFEVGAVQYISQLKPRFFVPVRFLDRADIVTAFSRDYTSSKTTVLPFIRPGSVVTLRKEDGIFLASNIQLLQTENRQ